VAQSDSAPKRCAIYTRKSSEEGLEQNFNSLHAQRPAKHSSEVRPVKAGAWSRQHMTMADSPAQRWSGRRSKRCSLISRRSALM
jgi:hypothetical protein